MEHLNNLNYTITQKLSGTYEYNKISEKERVLLDAELIKIEAKLAIFFINGYVKKPEDLKTLNSLILKLIAINRMCSGFELKAKMVNELFDEYIDIEQ